MYVITKTKGETASLAAKELNAKQIKSMGSDLAQRILFSLAEKQGYPKELAKRLKVHEQKVYYHIRKLEKAGVIEIARTTTVQGAKTNFYTLVDPAFVIKFKNFETMQKISELEEQPASFLEPFIDNGLLNATIIVGSPDPHGPEKARSRDGYYGIDFALFLGTFLNYVPSLHVKLDTETRTEDLQGNLILIGGPVVNTITEKINHKLPIKFDRKNNWAIYSSISGKTYHSDEMGVIEKIKNPFNPKKEILLIAGKRYAGTKAVVTCFIKHFKETIEGNKFDSKVPAKIIEGIDLDSDGQVDDAEIIE